MDLLLRMILLTELYWLAHDPRHITRRDEMSNAHCPLPPILYTSQLKGVIEEGFCKVSHRV